jgi:hypothetical protein
MVDRNETREPDTDQVRDALGEAGERSQRGTRPGLDHQRVREARDRLAGSDRLKRGGRDEGDASLDQAPEGASEAARPDMAEGDGGDADT